jgi:hypothetical protein
LKLLLPLLLVVITSPLSRSCKKELSKDTAVSGSVGELLSQNTWKAQEIRIQFNDNRTLYYKRGSSGNTYDSDKLKFDLDGTGTYYFEGASYPTTWIFTDQEKTKMKIVIDQPPRPINIYLENIQVTESLFRYAQYANSGSVSYLASCTRIPD